MITFVAWAARAMKDFLGGLQNLFAPSWQQRLGKQSIVRLQGWDRNRKRFSGGGWHCIYSNSVFKAVTQFISLLLFFLFK